MIYQIGSRGDKVRSIQQLVGATVDGVFGPETANALRTFQRNLGITADGVWGPQTETASTNFFNWLGSQNNAATAPVSNVPTPAPVRQPTGPERDAMSQLKAWLGNFGLESLAEKSWDFIVKNGYEPSQLRMWIYEQPEFAARFPAMKTLQAKQRAVSPEEYIRLEKQYKQVMQNAGMVSQFFDSPNDFTSLIENEIDPQIFEKRVNDGFQRVANASPSVRQAFTNYFGISGDTALAAFFIDPQRATPAIMEAARAAEIGGAALSYNVDVDVNYATKLAQMGVSYSQALEGMQRVSQMRYLFDTSVGEAAVVPGVSPASTVTGTEIQGGRPSVSTSLPTISTNINAANPSLSLIDQSGAEYVFNTNEEIRNRYERRLAQRVFSGRGERTEGVVTRTGRTSLG